MRVGRGLVVAVACVVLGVTACSGDGDDPVVLPSATEGSSTSPPPTGSPPSTSAEPTPTTTLVLPDEHVEEVDAFVREFFAAYNAAQDTGDFTTFDAMYLPQCAGCIQMRDELAGWLADGGTVEGADWVILQQSSSTIADNYNALLVAYRTEGTRSDGAGGDVQSIGQSPAEAITLFLLSAPALVVGDLNLGESA